MAMAPKTIIVVDRSGEDVKESVADQAEFAALLQGHEASFSRNGNLMGFVYLY
jgi:hypothetical protein